MRTIFLDRDGVINENSSEHVKSWDEFVFLPHAFAALRLLRQADFRVFVVTNQAIVSRGLASPQVIDDIHARMITQVDLSGGRITAVRYCPHDHHERCKCRKPEPGMLFDLAREWQIDLGNAYMVGDALTDIAAAQAAGCRSVLVRTGRGMQQATLPEMALHRPDFIAPNLLGAVQWILRQHNLATPLFEREVGLSRSVYAAPALVQPG